MKKKNGTPTPQNPLCRVCGMELPILSLGMCQSCYMDNYNRRAVAVGKMPQRRHYRTVNEIERASVCDTRQDLRGALKCVNCVYDDFCGGVK